MTIDYKILIGKKLSSQQKKNAQAVIDTAFDEVNTIYNNWNPDSEVSRLNSLPAKSAVTISPQLSNLLVKTQEVVVLSNGLFDPTVEPLQKLWKEKLAMGRVPSDEEIAAVAPLIGWHNIHFNEKTFYKDHSDTRLDLCGIAKGLCVDILTERLNDAGYRDLYVEWGGEIRTSGKHPEGRLWRIFISNLGDTDPDHAVDSLSLEDQAIAASGDYWQCWAVTKEDEKDEERVETYTHIVNPLTKRALKTTQTSIASVNVLAPTCAMADGLATAAMLFPDKAEAQKWATELREKRPELAFWILTREESDETITTKSYSK